jgi:hypothetical protein
MTDDTKLNDAVTLGFIAQNIRNVSPLPRISLADIKASLDAIETLYPREKIAAYMKMSRPTHDEFLRRINPWGIGTADISSEQMVALEFNGVQLRIDNMMPDGAIDIYNSDDQVITRCKL